MVFEKVKLGSDMPKVSGHNFSSAHGQEDGHIVLQLGKLCIINGIAMAERLSASSVACKQSLVPLGNFLCLISFRPIQGSGHELAGDGLL